MSLFTVNRSAERKSLQDNFIVPPFSVLDARSQYWLDRRHLWESLLNDRADNVRDDLAAGNTGYHVSFDSDHYYGLERNGKISTFDPFLTEILVRWFSKPGNRILDPFAGGIVRGAVSGLCGRNYVGFDISREQVRHNVTRFAELYDRNCRELRDRSILWVDLDSELMGKAIPNGSRFDMLMTCPPYYDLEKYTDDPEDLSNQKSYKDFILKFTRIMSQCYNVLRDDTFAAVVVGEIRDKDGMCYGFVGDTVEAMREAGFQYYNDAVLIQRVVSLKVRCPKYFDQSRKLGRNHQNVLVFYKGDVHNIESKFGRFER